MSLGEFDVISRFFTRPPSFQHSAVHVGVGDDCALLSVSPGHVLTTSMDLLVAGRHFFPDVNPKHLGHKALAVNLSDLAACGAKPLAFLLGISLPRVDQTWLSEFSAGLFALADQHGCVLMGGDTTACDGPVTISITVFGEVPVNRALLRSGARVGDGIYVSGQLGDARLALEHRLGKLTLPPTALQAALPSLELPIPRISLGIALRGIASACIDLSDGLYGDLQHVLAASRCGADLFQTSVLSCSGVQSLLPADFSSSYLLQTVSSGGDDYELLFTAPDVHSHAIQAIAARLDTDLHRIGRITESPGIRMLDEQGVPLQVLCASFDHFSASS
jgi:thiamine-monophosphate kinase